MELVLGCAAFALFFLGDANDWRWHVPALRGCFPAGVLALVGGTAMYASFGGAWTPVRLLTLAGAAGFTLALVYTLFFALSAKDAYIRQDGQRSVCTTGVYALCRHPGVLWFAGVYLCLSVSLRVPLKAGALFTALNVLLVWFEDKKVFPARLAGYEEYRRTTPFLIPTRISVRRAFGRN